MKRLHTYKTQVEWTGNKGMGTVTASAYERSHSVSVEGKPQLLCSSDAPFRGDVSKHNPEDFLLTALSSCHMLWYLHLCADAGIVVSAYVDNATAKMQEHESGGGNFIEATLHPTITLKNAEKIERAKQLHEQANKKCFIANSCNFPVKHEATYIVEP